AVTAQPIERKVLAHTVVEESSAGPDYGLRCLAPRCEAPGDAHAWRDIPMAADPGLRFISQARTDGEIWANAPVVQHEQADIVLVDAGERIAGGDGELARAAASGPDLLRGPASLLTYESDAIAVE